MLNIGLDIGGANTKLVAFEMPNPIRGAVESDRFRLRQARCQYFPFWEKSKEFSGFLRALLSELSAEPHRLAVTMTAELADCYPTKVQGVSSILRAVQEVDDDFRVFLRSGALVPVVSALANPIEVAAANWLAPAVVLGGIIDRCIYLDVGSTTTDIIPVKNGRSCVSDPSDQGRLTRHELVYSGALRTNAANAASHLMLHGQPIGTASELFSSVADVNLLLGLISEDQYSMPTFDGGPATFDGARARIARLVCSDPESLSREDALGIASHIHSEQVQEIARHLMTIISREGFSPDLSCVVAGVGRHAIGIPAARQSGLRKVVEFHEVVGKDLHVKSDKERRLVSDHATAASLALLARWE